MGMKGKEGSTLPGLLLPAQKARKGQKIRLPVVVWYLGQGVHPSHCLGRDAVLPKSLYSQGERQQCKGHRAGSWHKSPPNKLRSLLSG